MLPSPLVSLNLGSKYLKHNVFYHPIESHHQHFLYNLKEIYSKYILKFIFINNNGGYITFEASGMVLNVDFRDIRAIEPLPKFEF